MKTSKPLHRIVLVLGLGLASACAKQDNSAGEAQKSAPAAQAPKPAAEEKKPAPEAPDPNACPKDAKPITFNYVDFAFDWSKTPTLTSVPADKVLASVGGKVFELPKIQLWVHPKDKKFELRTSDGVVLGPDLDLPGVPKAGFQADDKYGDHPGLFQIPKKGDTVACFRQSISHPGDHARIVKLTRYDGKTADGSFVTTWATERDGKEVHLWAGGTFKNAEVTLW